MMTFPLLFAAVIGFNHAFEADHVLAVGNIVNKRTSFRQALRDGLFWGLGHTSMIFVIGCLIILGKAAIAGSHFELFEVIVGISLILLGGYRLFRTRGHDSFHHVHHTANHRLAYTIGLIHGLAGSGAVVLVAMSQLENAYESVLYLIIFGVGSMLGMMVVAGVFNLPFSRRIKATTSFQMILVLVSALLCIGYGGWMILRYFM